MINSMGPLWDGNEVWLIAAGGITFAAFPTVYAVMFSTLYSALMPDADSFRIDFKRCFI